MGVEEIKHLFISGIIGRARSVPCFARSFLLHALGTTNRIARRYACTLARTVHIAMYASLVKIFSRQEIDLSIG